VNERVSGRPNAGRPGTLLSVEGAIKDFPGQRALDRMSFTVAEGEIHALLGENGAGKSTLIKAISGAITLDSGTVVVCGTELANDHTPDEAIAAGLSVVYQHGNLVPSISITENILLTQGLPTVGGAFVSIRKANTLARTFLDRVGLNLDPRTVVSSLTPHQNALVSIAKALAAHARLIFLDEPTSALLPAEVDLMFGQMRKLTEEGIGFVFVTHRLAEVFKISDRITVMRDGRLVNTWKCDELDHDRLVDQLVGPEKTLAEPVDRGDVDFGDVVLDVQDLEGATFQGVSFTVREREVLGIASLPGEGAPEVIEALYGIKKSRGRVAVRGRSAKLTSPSTAISSGFALVPKDRLHQSIIPGLSVADNALLAVSAQYITDPVLRFVKRKAARRAAAGVVEQMRVKTPSLDAPISSLSGGNQQKVIIGRWLIRKADVYLLDSPTAAVDVHAKSEIYGFIRSIADSGAAVIFTSTEVEEFARVCDRVIVLSGGRIQGELTGDGITVASVMRLSFGRKNDE
jgi:ABC-type sugar transport system ATPase subunit